MKFKCKICGKELIGKQKKYCSNKCRQSNYRKNNQDKIKEYRLKNKDKIKAWSRAYYKGYDREYYLKNKDKIKEWQRKYYKENHEKCLNRKRIWEKKNPEKKRKQTKKAVDKFRTEKKERFNELQMNCYRRNKTKWNSRSLTLKIVKGIKGHYKKIDFDFPKKCKQCGTTENCEIHHEIYPTLRIEIEKAIKEGKIYYLCRMHHRSLKKSK